MKIILPIVLLTVPLIHFSAMDGNDSKSLYSTSNPFNFPTRTELFLENKNLKQKAETLSSELERMKLQETSVQQKYTGVQIWAVVGLLEPKLAQLCLERIVLSLHDTSNEFAREALLENITKAPFELLAKREAPDLEILCMVQSLKREVFLTEPLTATCIKILREHHFETFFAIFDLIKNNRITQALQQEMQNNQEFAKQVATLSKGDHKERLQDIIGRKKTGSPSGMPV
jgi:hypothetical protein